MEENLREDLDKPKKYMFKRYSEETKQGGMISKLKDKRQKTDSSFQHLHTQEKKTDYMRR
jgi:hypothetical protein